MLVPSEATARDLAELYGVDRGRVTITPLGVEVPPSRTGPGPSGSRDLGVRGPFLLAVGTLEPRRTCPGCWTPSARWPASCPATGWWWWARSAGGRAAADLGLGAGQAGRPGRRRPPARPLPGRRRPRLPEPVRGLRPARAGGHGQRDPGADQRPFQPARGRRRRRLLVDLLDRSAIAAGLVRLAGDDDLRRRLVEAGRRRAAGFTWRATAAATWAAYREVAERAR